MLLAGAAAAERAGAESAPSQAQPSRLELQKATQNPIADLISVPLQSNFNFGCGAKGAPQSSSTQYVLNIQPVIPITLGATGFNLITRPILPVIRQPNLIEGGDTWGWGDLQLQAYLSPTNADKLIWGVGGVLQPPTASDSRELGTQKWSAGPAAVLLAMPGKWVFGGLVTQLWSFAGANFERGWYVSSSPVVTANWEAEGDDNTFTVPMGAASGG